MPIYPNYFVEPKSRFDIRKIARVIRESFHLENVKWFPIVAILDMLPEIFEGFSYEVVIDNELPKETHADTDILSGHIRIKQSVYDGACAGNGRDRMTIAHEIGHFLMICVCGFKMERNFERKCRNACRDPEWQAKCFAGELLVSADLMHGCSVEEIMKTCGVSRAAAEYQYNHM